MTFRIVGTRLMAVLGALFNVLALNLAMIITSLPLITVPVAATAASAALDQWTRAGEDRIVRQFIIEFRRQWSARTLLGAGMPLLAGILGLAEIRHFIAGTALADRAGLCLGGGALIVTAGALGYVFQLLVDDPGMRLLDLWSLSARLAGRNLLTVAIPSAVPAVGVVILTARDPAVLLLGLPVFLLYALKRFAGPGLRRRRRDRLGVVEGGQGRTEHGGGVTVALLHRGSEVTPQRALELLDARHVTLRLSQRMSQSKMSREPLGSLSRE